MTDTADKGGSLLKINLGSGHWKLDGWVNVDIDPESEPDVLADLSGPLPFEDGSAGFMHTEDFLDQLDLQGARSFLQECHRILAPGGVIRILTPDVEQLTRMYLEQPDELIALWRENVPLDLELESAAEVLNLGMRFAGHTFLYDAATLAQLLEECDFEPRRCTFNESECPELRGVDLRGPDGSISLYFEGRKSS